MARNRKYQSAAVRFGPALKAVILCVVIGGAGVGYVWQQSQINELGRQIKQREQKLAALQDQNRKLGERLATLRSPARLNERVQALNLGLALPPPNQVCVLPEPSATATTPENTPGPMGDSPSGAGLAMH